MTNSVVMPTIWVMAVVLCVLLVIRIVLLIRMRGPGHRTGFRQTCGTRQVQEDCHAVKKTGKGIMAVLADGMGRNHCGAVSSSMTVETALDIFSQGDAFYNPNYFFQKTLHQANRRILDRLDDGAGGASAALVLIEGLTLYYAIVGNVQVAVFRGDELTPITEGHTVNVLAEKRYCQGSLTKQETIAFLREQRLYNFVGSDSFRDVEVFDQPIKLRRGDTVVIMTDGVYDAVPHTKLEDMLGSGRNCQRRTDAIVAAVDAASGERDNASVLLLAV